MIESDDDVSGDEYKPESAGESSDEEASSGVAESDPESASEPETPVKSVRKYYHVALNFAVCTAYHFLFNSYFFRVQSGSKQQQPQLRNRTSLA